MTVTLAHWLARALSDADIGVRKIDVEDWGWCIGIENPAFPLWIGCGPVDGDPETYLCFIEPSRPIVRKWLRRVRTVETVENLARALERALARNPDISDIVWHQTQRTGR